MKTGKAKTTSHIGGGGAGHIGGGGAGHIGGGGAGHIGGGGAGHIGGGGAGHIGGGAKSKAILEQIAKELEKLSQLFGELANTPISVPDPEDVPVIVPLSTAAGAAPPPTGVDFVPQVPYAGENQQGDELCWVAVATGVQHYFNPASQLRQCELAKTLLRIKGNCCTGSGSTGRPCDKPGDLGVALRHVNHLAAKTANEPNPKDGKPMSFADVRTQIDNKLPVCIYIEWPGQDTGHFILISGYHEAGATQYLYVNDPLYGNGPQPYDRIVSNYNLEQGTWKSTYRLKV